MKIEWTVDSPIFLNSEMMFLMQQAADCSLRAESVDLPCFICVRICDDAAIAEINAAQRGISQSTDVLSFPSLRFPSGRTARHCADALRREYDDTAKACFLGDIVISMDHMLRQAEAYGHSAGREAAYLLVHGICHLMGYDHLEEEDRQKMRSLEEKILSSVNINRDEVTSVNDDTLLALARSAMERSYSCYSRFPVGAALLCSDGRVFQGCNIENASFGLTCCAERTAVFKAVSEGARAFEAIAIASEKPAWPCGACRQVLNEFAPDLRVLITWGDGERAEKTLSELLPNSFGPENLL